MPEFEMDAALIKGQIEELVTDTKVKVKMDKHMDVATSVRCTDDGFTVRLNPTKIRSQPKLDAYLELARQVMDMRR